MSLYEYIGDGTGEIAGIGIVFNGRVVDTDLDLSERDDFEAVTGKAEVTSDEEVRAMVSRTPEQPDEEVVAEVEADALTALPSPAVSQPSAAPAASLPTRASDSPASATTDVSPSQGG